MIKFKKPLTAISIAALLAVVLGIAAGSSAAEIVRTGEGRNFYNNIMIPASAETLSLSGSGAQEQADGTWGDMEQQTIDTFGRFQETLEAQGWSLEDIVQVRAFAVSGDDGELDFAVLQAGRRRRCRGHRSPTRYPDPDGRSGGHRRVRQDGLRAALGTERPGNRLCWRRNDPPSVGHDA